MLPSDKSLRWVQDDAGSMEVRPKRFTVGAWVRGPMTGVNIHARLYPWVVRALTGIVRAWDPTHCFTAITPSMNVKASPHKDKYNEKCSSNLLLPCSSFQGEQLFVENADGTHQLQRGGVTGHIFSTQEPTIFSPCCTHATLARDQTPADSLPHRHDPASVSGRSACVGWYALCDRQLVTYKIRAVYLVD